MKYLALILALAAMSAHAEVVGTADNQAGGKIIFYDAPCSVLHKDFPKLRGVGGWGAGIVDSGGQAQMVGCWQSHQGPMIPVTWADGSYRMYDNALIVPAN